MIWFEVFSGLGRPELAPSGIDDLEAWWMAVALHWPVKDAPKIRSLVLLVMRSIWLERNNRVFDRIARTEVTLLDAIMADAARWNLVGGFCEIFPFFDAVP